MEWEIVINDEHKYVEVITRGIADKDSSLNMAKAIINETKANNIKKILIDHRNLENATGCTIDIYERPKLLRESGAPSGVKLALVIKPEHWEHFKFFETVSVNQGFLVSIFHDKEEAMSWLL